MNQISWLLPVVLILATIMDLLLFLTYMRFGHPWKDILTEDGIKVRFVSLLIIYGISRILAAVLVLTIQRRTLQMRMAAMSMVQIWRRMLLVRTTAVLMVRNWWSTLKLRTASEPL